MPPIPGDMALPAMVPAMPPAVPPASSPFQPSVRFCFPTELSFAKISYMLFIVSSLFPESSLGLGWPFDRGHGALDALG